MPHPAEIVTEQQLTNTPAGGALVGVIKGQTVFHKDGSLGGYAVGRLHQNGGIDGIVLTDGHRVEFQGNEIVMTAPVSFNQKKYDLNGRKLTGRQICSMINVENGGVAFADGGEIPSRLKLSGKKYNFNGKSTYDTDIVMKCDCGCSHLAAGGKIRKEKMKEAIEMIKKLKPSKKILSYEINAAKLKPQQFLQMIADQALGYTRGKNGKRSDVPHPFGPQLEHVKGKYGPKLTDLAIKLYPVDNDGIYSDGGELLPVIKSMMEKQPGNALVVVCKSVGNPDFGQNPLESISFPLLYPVESLSEASNVCRLYIQENDLGGGNWVGGQVYDVTGKMVAYISYNGRVWSDSDNSTEITGDDLTKKWYPPSAAYYATDDITKPSPTIVIEHDHDDDSLELRGSEDYFFMSTCPLPDDNNYPSLTDFEETILFRLHLHPDTFVILDKEHLLHVCNLKNAGIIYETAHPHKYPEVEIRLTETGKDFVLHHSFKPENKAIGGPVDELLLPAKKIVKSGYFKGLSHRYRNAYELNKAIEEFVDQFSPNEAITPEQKVFISYYSGYGGLESFGAKGKGLLYEYFTPDQVVRRMWGLAYKHGYEGGTILEPSCGSGAFLKYAPHESLITGYEINEYSYKICKLLFPAAKINLASFETLFIKNNSTIRGRVDGLEKFQLVIGNPPYGDFGGKYAGMGEKPYTKATNFIDYFIFRSLDLLAKGGLLVMIIGTEVANGGTPWLQKPATGAKAEIMKKADLLDAYRLPNGVFDRTDVLSDIIVLQKK